MRQLFLVSVWLLVSTYASAGGSCIKPSDELKTRRHEDKHTVALGQPAFGPRQGCSALMSYRKNSGDGGYWRSDAGFSRTRSDLKGRIGITAGKKNASGLYTEMGFRMETGDVLGMGTSGAGSQINRTDLVMGYDTRVVKLEQRLIRKRQLDPARTSRMQSDTWWDYQSRVSLKPTGPLGIRPYVQYENKAINRISARLGARNEVVRVGVSLDF